MLHCDSIIPSTHFRSGETPRGRLADEIDHLLGGNFRFESDAAEAPDAFENRGYMVGGLAVMLRSHTPHTLTRGVQQIRSTQMDHYGVVLSAAPGGFDLDADGSRMHVEEGVPVLLDMARPVTGHFGRGQDIVLYVPRDALASVLPAQYDLHGVTLSGGSGRMLTSYMRTLAATLPELRRSEAQHATNATLHLLGAGLAPQRDSLGMARATTENGLRRQALRFVEENLTDPSLGAEEICAALRVSRSTVYRLFEPYHGTAAYIRERRLARCHAEIGSAGGRVHLARVADRFGFRTATNFSRAFRAQYGYSPSDAKAMALPARPVVNRSGLRDQGFSHWLQEISEWAAAMHA
ncbi:helix-turn-helix domain-containing protein [Variovorax sp. dw_954]|uniref:helix-turn-helix domain-containing protein n=1 Tax=Variovorax sp. dw_954 TaxID=2720078 RepID=UPI001BD55BFB|nr:helix-turn-helix domain-containing protein [Variovorax sp. dw_954]